MNGSTRALARRLGATCDLDWRPLMPAGSVFHGLAADLLAHLSVDEIVRRVLLPGVAINTGTKPYGLLIYRMRKVLAALDDEDDDEAYADCLQEERQLAERHALLLASLVRRGDVHLDTAEGELRSRYTETPALVEHALASLARAVAQVAL